MGTMRSTPLSRCLHRSTADDRRGFTLIETMVAVGILVFLTMVIFGLLSASQSAYNDADTGIQLRDILREADQKISWELSHTGHDGGGVSQFTIFFGTGANGSDKIRFSVPVACDTTSSFLTTAGSPSHWGAYLTWGCDKVSCADADGNCATVEYKYIQYALNADGTIVRSALGPLMTVVAQQTIASNITDLHFATSGVNSLTFTLNARLKSPTGRTVTATTNQTVHYMN